MSDVKISCLPYLACVDVCNSVLPIVQGGVTYQTAACNVGGSGPVSPFIANLCEPTGIEAYGTVGANNLACGKYSFANGCSNTICNNYVQTQIGDVNAWTAYEVFPYATCFCAAGDQTACLNYCSSVVFCDTTNAQLYNAACLLSYYFNGTNTTIRFNVSGTSCGDIGTLNLGSGSNGCTSAILNGSHNVSKGSFNTIGYGQWNTVCGGGMGTALGSGNVSTDSGTNMSGNFNLSSASAYYEDYQCPYSYSGMYIDFVGGCACLPSYYGDFTCYLPAGAEVRAWCKYASPAGSVFCQGTVGMSCSGPYGQTIICLTEPLSFSGYFMKAGPYPTNSDYFYNNVNVGGWQNTVSGYVPGTTVSGGYMNQITASGYTTVIGGNYSEIFNSWGTVAIGSTACSTYGGYNTFLGSEGCVTQSYGIVNLGGSQGTCFCSYSSYSFAGPGYGMVGAGACYSFMGAQLSSYWSGQSCMMGPFSFLGTGNANRIASNGSFNAIVNGCANIIGGSSSSTFIGGGTNNNINGGYVGILIGANNTICTSNAAIVSGGGNTITGQGSVVILGASNTVSNCYSAVVGNFIGTDRDNTLFVNNLSIKGVPTSASGLPSGSVWSDGGTLKIV